MHFFTIGADFRAFLPVLAVVFVVSGRVGADGNRLAKFRVMSENCWIIRPGEGCVGLGRGAAGCMALAGCAVNLAVL